MEEEVKGGAGEEVTVNAFTGSDSADSSNSSSLSLKALLLQDDAHAVVEELRAADERLLPTASPKAAIVKQRIQETITNIGSCMERLARSLKSEEKVLADCLADARFRLREEFLSCIPLEEWSGASPSDMAVPMALMGPLAIPRGVGV